MIRYLLNSARSFIFSTAPPPPALAGALAALELLEERPHRVERLQANARALRGALASEGFPVAVEDMHIVPLIVGEERDAMRMCQEAIERGVFAQAIRPPTVPAGTSRLRLAAMASHTASDMRMAAGVLGAAARKLGLDPAQMGPPLPEPDFAGAVEGEPQITHEALPALEARLAEGAPFDVERRPVRPSRPPAPVGADAGLATAPFDGERESSVAHAA
jgi:glycine C-acetyltransferase/8-amino-7-oxononanoate synthase